MCQLRWSIVLALTIWTPQTPSKTINLHWTLSWQLLMLAQVRSLFMRVMQCSRVYLQRRIVVNRHYVMSLQSNFDWMLRKNFQIWKCCSMADWRVMSKLQPIGMILMASWWEGRLITFLQCYWVGTICFLLMARAAGYLFSETEWHRIQIALVKQVQSWFEECRVMKKPFYIGVFTRHILGLAHGRAGSRYWRQRLSDHHALARVQSKAAIADFFLDASLTLGDWAAFWVWGGLTDWVNTVFLTGFWLKSYNLGSTMADVAQLVESQIVILVVAGSSPVVRPMYVDN